MSEAELKKYLKESGISYDKKDIKKMDNGYYQVETKTYTLYIDSKLDKSNVTIWSQTPGDGGGGRDYIIKEAKSLSPPASIIAVDKNWKEKSKDSSLVAAVKFAGKNDMKIQGIAHDSFSHGASSVFKVSNKALKEYKKIYGHSYKGKYAMTVIDPSGCGPTKFTKKNGELRYPYLEKDNIDMYVVMGEKGSQKYTYSQQSWNRIYGYYGNKVKKITTPIQRHGAIANSCCKNHLGPWLAGFSSLGDKAVKDGKRGNVKTQFKIKSNGKWISLKNSTLYKNIEKMRLANRQKGGGTFKTLSLNSDGIISNDYSFVNTSMNKLMTQLSRDDFPLKGISFSDPTGLSDIINSCIEKYYNIADNFDNMLAQQTVAVNSYAQRMVDLDNALTINIDDNISKNI